MQLKREWTVSDIAAILVIIGTSGAAIFSVAGEQKVQGNRINNLEQERLEFKQDIVNRLVRIENTLDRGRFTHGN